MYRKKTDLSAYQPPRLHGNPHWMKRALWFYVNALCFKTSLFPFSGIKVSLLRWFGASIGKGVVIKPCVNIKYPWLLQIGQYSWIGEKVWIDNLAAVCIGQHVCLSQGAMLLTGSHDYKDPAFAAVIRGITLVDGVWIGARAVVNQGITAAAHSVLFAGSVATKNLLAWSVYQGNPAVKIRDRIFDDPHPGKK